MLKKQIPKEVVDKYSLSLSLRFKFANKQAPLANKTKILGHYKHMLDRDFQARHMFENSLQHHDHLLCLADTPLTLWGHIRVKGVSK